MRYLLGLFKVLCLRFEVAPETKVTLNFGHRTLNTPVNIHKITPLRHNGFGLFLL